MDSTEMLGMADPWGSTTWGRSPAPVSKPTDPDATVLKVCIERVRSANSSSGWASLAVTYDKGTPATAVGTMPEPRVGTTVVLRGAWGEHRKWGWQFQFDSYDPELPKDASQAEAYLASGSIRGIGKRTAAAIVSHFGDQTLEILETDIGRLEEVPGIAEKTRAKIAEGWAEMAQQHAVAIALTSVGAPASLAVSIWEEFGTKGAQLVTDNPYALTKAKGVGFRTCDKIAARLGWAHTDPRRLSAGLAHTIEAAEGSGHCYLPMPDLLEAASDLLETPAMDCMNAVALAVEEERIVVDCDRVYTKQMHYLERDLADHLDRIAAASAVQPSATQAAAIDQMLERRSLSKEQAQAVRSVMASPLTVLTGGPGVGKSHTIAAIAEAARLCRWRVGLCAPTGRAARRMSELDPSAPAATVHRLIGLGGGEAQNRYTPENPLQVELLVCDESSMLDVSLARHLARAIATGTRLLLVGDVDQLPSVGPGSVLSDLIDSGRAAVTALTKIFRQVEDSGIIQVAHTINAGQWPSWQGWEDLHLWSCDSPEVVARRVVDTVSKHLPSRDIAADQVQVLAPQRRGSCGVNELNRRLQATLNPDAERQYVLRLGEEEVAFRPGDRAIVIKNNYDKGRAGVFNGTPVRVVEVNADPGKEQPAVTIETDEGEIIPYLASEVKELALAYAITVHKSQGSQYPCVVVVVTAQAYPMLVRNLLYTAITRAQSRVIVIGQPKAVAKAIKTTDAVGRHTALAERLGRPGPVGESVSLPVSVMR